MPHHHAMSSCHIIMSCHHTTSSFHLACHVIMPHHHAMSTCHIIMPCHHSTSSCHVTMTHLHEISTCYVIMPHHHSMSSEYTFEYHVAAWGSATWHFNQKFPFWGQTSKRNIFCIRSPFDMPFSQLESAWRAIRHGTIFFCNMMILKIGLFRSSQINVI